jgi:TonB family protein
MRALWGIVLFAAVTTSFTSGQQTTPSAPSQLADDQPERVKVYTVGPGVTAPKLLSTSPIQIDHGKCKKMLDLRVIFSVLVDSTGQPRNLMFLQPLGIEIDKVALQVASADRFVPGTHDGRPAVIGQTLNVDLQTCVEEKKDEEGNKAFLYRLRSQPSQEFRPLADSPEMALLAPKDWSWGEPNGSAPQIKSFGGSVKAPVLLNHAEPFYTKAARYARTQGICTVYFVLDRNGMPQNIQITKSLDNGLDQSAIDAVNQYRFEPAMKDGEPIPVRLHVEISFHLH